MYKLITGFYPSEKTAEKVLNKARAICKQAHIEPFYDGFTVVLAKSDSIQGLEKDCLIYISHKLYCGVMIDDDRIRKQGDFTSDTIG